MTDDIIGKGIIELELDQGTTLVEAQAIVDDVRARIESLRDVRGEPKIGARTKEFDAAVRKTDTVLEKIDRRTVEVSIKAKTDELDRQVKDLDVKLQKEKHELKYNVALDEPSKNRLEASIFELERKKDQFSIKKAQFVFETRGVAKTLADIEAINAARRDSEAAVNKEYDALAKVEKLRTLSELNKAKEAVRVASLERTYHKLSETLSSMPNEIRGFGPAAKKENVNLQIDKSRLFAELAATKAELHLLLKSDDFDVRLKANSSDLEGIKKRVAALIGFVTDKFDSVGKLRINAGPFSGSLATFGSAITGLLPLITSLGGALTSLVGVAGGGALGAGAVGGGIFSGLALNMVGATAAAKGFISELGAVEKAQKKLETAVQKNKPGSKQAVKAEHELANVIERVNPATAQAALGLEKLKQQWKALVVPTGSADFSRALTSGIETVNKMLPGLAHNTNETLGIITQHIDSMFAHLRKPEEAKAFVELGKDANKFLGPALGGVERFGAGILHIFESATRIFAGPLGKAVFNFGKSFDNATQPGEKLDHTIAHLGEDAAKVIHFFAELGKVLFDVLKGSDQAGGEFVDTMSKGLEKWDKFLKSTQGKNDMAKFFHESVEITKELWKLLTSIVKLLFSVSTGISPIVLGMLKASSSLSGFIGKLLGGQDAAKKLGEVMAVAFAVKRVATFAGAIGGAVGRAKELASVLKEVGIKGALTKGLGGGVAAGIVPAATEGAAAMGTAITEAGTAVAAEFRAALSVGGVTRGAEQGGATIAQKVLSKAPDVGIIPINEAGTAAATTTAVEAGAADVAAGGEVATGLGLATTGPVAIAVGAALVAGLLLFKKNKSPIDELSHEIAAGLGKSVEQGVKKGLEKAQKTEAAKPKVKGEGVVETLEREDEEQAEHEHPHATAARRRTEARHRQEAEDQRFQLGRGFGTSLVTKVRADTAGASGAERALQISNEAVKKFSDGRLPDAFKKGGANAVVELVRGMEEKKELPAHSVDEIRSRLEAKIPALRGAWHKGGADSIDAYWKAIGQLNNLKGLESLVRGFRSNFEQLPRIAGLNSENVVTRVRGEMDVLKNLMTHGSAEQRIVAAAEWKKLKEQAGEYFGQIRHTVQTEINHASVALKAGKAGPEAVERAYSKMVGAIKNEMAAGLVHTQDGMKKIASELRKELSTLGINTSKISDREIRGEGEAKTPGGHTPTAARGGLFQIGKRGERGQDNQHIIVGKGEQVAVFTHHQQEKANKALAHMGGLAGLFSDKRPHYMASGGFTPGAGTNYSVGEEPEIARRLNIMARALGLHLIGISGYRSPQHSVEVGGFANDPHTRGEASDTPGVEGVSEAILEKYGLTRPFPGAAEADHIQLYGSFNKLGAAVAGVIHGATAAAAAVFKKLNVPQSHQHGLIGALVHGVLKKGTDAANKRGAELVAKHNAAFGPGVGSGGGGHAAGSAQMRKWVIEGLKADGIPPTPDLIGKLLYTMVHESGGKPNSENREDINFQQGHPSRGLMELTPENFAQYRNKSLPDNVFDPVANVAASIRYMIARYGQIVGKSPYARGGMVDKSGRYDKPALLVGEHAHEYVIDPKSMKGVKYLKDAAHDAGYHVTPAASNKHRAKSVTKQVSKQQKNLSILPEFKSATGLPVGVINPIFADVVAAVKTEEGALHTLEKNKETAIEKLKKSKDKGAKKVAQEHETGARQIAAAKAHLAAAKSKKAKDTAARELATAESNAKHKIKTANDSASAAVKEAEKKIRHIESGERAIHHGGKYENTDYIALGRLKKEESQTKAFKERLENRETELDSLNSKIDNKTKRMNFEAGRFNNTKDPKYGAAWRSLLAERKGLIATLEGDLRADKAQAETFAHNNPRISGTLLTSRIAELNDKVEGTEEAAIAAEAEQDPTVSAATEEAAAAEAKGPPSADEFVEQLGQKETLENLNEAYALATTTLIPDNPNTPENEEVPGLKAELKPAQELQVFWETRLKEAQSLKEPAATITDLANATTSARQAAFGLAQSLESAEGGAATNAYNDLQNFGKARKELYDTYGSNFAPIWAQPSGTTAAASAAAAQTSAAANVTAAPTTNNHITVNNSFSTPPADPHTWSTGVAWELGAHV